MTTVERNERIRARAHELWEQEGRPEGRAESHWAEALRQIEAEDAAAPPKPRRGKAAGAAAGGEEAPAKPRRASPKTAKGAGTEGVAATPVATEGAAATSGRRRAAKA